MPGLPRPLDYWPWTTAPPGPRRPARTHLGASRNLSCHPCSRTFTILPDWLVPSTPFSLRCRQQACERIAAGDSVEQRLSRTRCLCGPSEPTEPETTDFPSPLREAAVTFLHLIAPRTQRFSHVESQTTESRRAGGISISSARFPHTAPGCRRKLGFGNARK